MSVEKLINDLDDLILEGVSLPLSNGKCIIDREKAKELVEEIRLNMPDEMRQAQSIVSDRADILAKANKEAEEIIKRAEARAKKLVSQEEVVRLAAQRANEIVTVTQNRSGEIKRNTAEYANAVLTALEETLAKSLIDIKRSKQQIKTNAGK